MVGVRGLLVQGEKGGRLRLAAADAPQRSCCANSVKSMLEIYLKHIRLWWRLTGVSASSEGGATMVELIQTSPL
jgi:hypothetical protein